MTIGPNWIMLPIVLPMVTGVLSLFVAARPRPRALIGTLGLTANLCVAIAIAAQVFGGRIIALQTGDWPAPFGITVVVDALSAMMLVASALVLLAAYLYCIEQLRNSSKGMFHPLFHLLAMGVQWSLITGDLFNLFVAFELMLMSSYALLVLGTSRAQMRHAYKYVLLNLLGSMLFVTCCGLIYGHVGTLNFADLARLSHGNGVPRAAMPAVVVLLLVFGIKTAVFPVWFWLPDTYPTLPAGLGGLFGGLLTKVGAYVLLRVFVMVFGPADSVAAEIVYPIVAVSAGLTMLLGVLGAVSMNAVRQILSNHIISQVGYMMMAVALGLGVGLATDSREMAVAGGVFFIVHNMIVKSSLFLCGGLMRLQVGTDALERMGGLARRTPWLAAMFLLAAMSLAGLPPLSGFFAKFVLIREALRSDSFALAAVALVTSVLTLLSMVKIWSYAFWSPAQSQPAGEPAAARRAPLAVTATAALVIVSLFMGLGAEQVMNVSQMAARSIVEPAPYIDAVLGPDAIHPLQLTRSKGVGQTP